MAWKEDRKFGLLIITVIYIFAIYIGVITFRTLPEWNILMRIFIADLVATVFVYLSGLILNNASVYDPYWSVAPIVIIVLLIQHLNVYEEGVLWLLGVISYWGIRLTLNWAYTFTNLNHQDWRYDMLKNKFPRAYQLVNLAGINIFPTLVVYCALIPAIYYIQNSRITMITIVGYFICFVAATLQLISDLQMHRFRSLNPDRSKIINIGLWKYSRHPNYLGEILMWWGVYVIMLSALPNLWYLFFGPLINTIMFLVISIPMAERRLQAYKDNFEEYKARTGMFWTWAK